MIKNDERYHDYLHTDKCFNIDGACEKVRGYGPSVIMSVLLGIIS